MKRGGVWRKWHCRACGAPVRYGRTYGPACEIEVEIDEGILAPQAEEARFGRRLAGEPRLRDARRGRLAGEE